MDEKFTDRDILASVGETFRNCLCVGDSLRGRPKYDAIFGFFEKDRPTFYQSQSFPQVGREAHSSLRGYIDLNSHFALPMLSVP